MKIEHHGLVRAVVVDDQMVMIRKRPQRREVAVDRSRLTPVLLVNASVGSSPRTMGTLCLLACVSWPVSHKPIQPI